ncbi:type II secretion system F family protein [Quisquiliibacterium transsilvanicum]|uniref:Tight adherence protein B n=1 Tax=Quisquiliibacterium transsilvanicum TaxID=1549638 RepID=A0A7W8HFH4_9BURK|nr:type II secretion system F family protein [Quisquiliibacterium transsilvanicum]MBB5271051.1 tight adherence protein B [Quisquiliibacterium transsilvanicum]
MSNLAVAAAVLLFLAVFLAIEALYIWWNSSKGPEARRIDKRLRMMSAGGHVDSAQSTLLKQRMLSNSPGLERLLLHLPRIGSIDRLITQSGVDWTVASFLGTSGGLFLTGLLGGLVLRFPLPVSVFGAILLGLIPLEYLIFRRAQRLRRFEQVLPDALDLIGRALRAGHAFPSALQMAGSELPEPLGEEFRQTFDEVNYGISVQDALQNLATRVPSTDLGFFVIAVLIQRETGGNLAEVLDNISHIIRDRLKLLGKVRTLSAEGRFSALVLTLLPFFTAGLLFAIDSKFMSTLWTEPAGVKMIYGGLFFMVLGVLWMRKIIRIHV